jgi:hypothetical protein
MIASRVRELAYPGLDAFARDVQLVFDNCLLYNKPDTSYWKVANRLKGQAEAWIAAARERYEALLAAGQERVHPPFAQRCLDVLGNLGELEGLAIALRAVRPSPPSPVLPVAPGAGTQGGHGEEGSGAAETTQSPPHKRRKSEGSARTEMGVEVESWGPGLRRSARTSLSQRTLGLVFPAILPAMPCEDFADSSGLGALLREMGKVLLPAAEAAVPPRSVGPSPRRPRAAA